MSRLQGIGPTLTALVSGSMILGGRICRCIPTAAKWAWDMAAQDPAATAIEQEKADKAARKKAAASLKARRARRRKRAAEDEDIEDDDQDDDIDPETVTAPPVAPVVRGRMDTWGVLGIGTAIGAGALYAAWMLFGETAVTTLAPHQPLIMCGGGLLWVGAALMVAPPVPGPGKHDDGPDTDYELDDEEFEDDDQDDEELEGEYVEEDDGLSPGERLTRHVLMELAGLEAAYGGKGGLHVVSLIASAEALGLLSPGAMTKKAMRDWLEASKFPVEKSTRQPKGVRPIGSEVDYGIKVEQLTALLGSTVSEAVRRMYPDPVREAPAAPAPTPLQHPLPAPAGPPPGAPAEPVPGGVPGPRLHLVKPLSPDPSQGSTQDTA